MKVFVFVSRFPSITETFVYREVAALESSGVDVQLVSLVRNSVAFEQPEAADLAGRVTVLADLDRGRLARAQLYWLRRRPLRYLRTWLQVLVSHARSPRFLLRCFAVVPLAAAAARELDISDRDRVHAHFATHPTTAAVVVSSLTGAAVSATVHAHDLFKDRSGLGFKLRRCRDIVVISEYNREVLHRLWPELEAKISVIRVGVDTDALALERRVTTSDGGPPARSPTRFMAVGSLEERKGHDVLVNACDELRSRGISFECRIVGTGPLRPELEAQIANLALGSHVQLTGALTSSEVQALYRTWADVAVLACKTDQLNGMDGIPTALVEGAATGLPLVSTRLSGVPELVIDGETGFCCAPEDPSALADAMAELAADPALRHRMGTRAACLARTDYSLPDNVARLLELFRC